MDLVRSSRAQATEGRRGSVTVMALLVVVLISGLTIAFLQIGVAFNREQSRRVDDERALFIAESGFQEAIHAMRMGGTGGIGTMAAPTRFGNGVMWVESSPAGVALTRLRSVGLCGSGRIAIEGIVFHYAPPLFTTALFSNESFQIESGVEIDSFDSSLGSYALQLAASGTGYVGSDAIAQSNGDVIVGSSVEVHGDIYPGQDESVDVPGSSTVTGSLQPNATDRFMPPVITPAIAATAPLSVPADGITTLSSGDYHFPSLVVSSGPLTIEGPARLVVGDFDLQSNTDLILDNSGGPIEIYATGDFVLASNSDITTVTESAVGVSLYLVGGPTQVAVLSSNSQFYGTIYSPEGTVDVRSNFEVFGSIAANQLILNANVNVHFDEGLTNPPPVPEDYFVAGWSITAMPTKALSVNRPDPIQLMGLDPAAMPSPANAYQ